MLWFHIVDCGFRQIYSISIVDELHNMHAAHQRKWEQRTEFARHIHNMHFINKIRAKKNASPKYNKCDKMMTANRGQSASNWCSQRSVKKKRIDNDLDCMARGNVQYHCEQYESCCGDVSSSYFGTAEPNGIGIKCAKSKLIDKQWRRAQRRLESMFRLCAKLVQIDRTYVSCNYFIRFSFEPF